jgi:hypothetical protein
MGLNSRDCLETFERIADVNSFIFSYVAPETQVYFLRSILLLWIRIFMSNITSGICLQVRQLSTENSGY